MTQAEKRSMLLDDVPLRMKTARREAAPPAPTSSSGATSSSAGPMAPPAPVTPQAVQQGTRRPASPSTPPDSPPTAKARGLPPAVEDINAVLVAELQEACEETQNKWQPEEEQLWAARRRHLEKMNLFEAFKRVPRQEAQNPLTTVWVDKVFGDGWKSRLTVHGFRQKVDRTVDFYSETPQSQSARLLLTIAARDGLLVAAGDAEAAFLQAPLLEEVYVEPPPEAGEPRDVVYRALKAHSRPARQSSGVGSTRLSSADEDA